MTATLGTEQTVAITLADGAEPPVAIFCYALAARAFPQLPPMADHEVKR